MNKYTSSTPITPPNLVHDIKELIRACGPTANKNDQAIVAIKLCIAQGVDTNNHIIKSLMRAGFQHGHVASLLARSAGRSRERHFWWIDADGRYHDHDDV